MQTHAMMINWRHVTSRQNEDVGMLDTIGDRINDLLRSRGRADRGTPYTQVELFEMLTGKRPGPDGKYYSISTNKSTLNRIMLDKQEPSNDFLFAFCDMFDTDTEWILRGNTLESESSGKFISDEAEQVAAIVDTLPPELRSAGAQAEITKLQDKLHEAEKAATLAAQLDTIQEYGLEYLDMEDVREANAWLHAHFRVYVDGKTVVAIDNF